MDGDGSLTAPIRLPLETLLLACSSPASPAGMYGVKEEKAWNAANKIGGDDYADQNLPGGQKPVLQVEGGLRLT